MTERETELYLTAQAIVDGAGELKHCCGGTDADVTAHYIREIAAAAEKYPDFHDYWQSSWANV